VELDDAESDLLNEQAVKALIEAKRRGRDATVSFEEIRDQALVASWAQAQSVRKLLSERQIQVAFQPIWDIDTGTILGYEALARPDMEYGLVGPQEAFDVATRIGRARELDEVCRVAILARARELPRNAKLFVNIAPESLEHESLSGADLARSVVSAGFDPEQVVLELTERSIVRPDTMVRQAHMLRTFGFKLALDDTGAGNAGLGVLSQLQVDYVKVDRAVVNHAGSDQAARAVLAGIFALAREMGAYVIAEGIETVDMLELVRDMSDALFTGSRGGRGVQGFLLGAPSNSLPAKDSPDQSFPIAAARLGRKIGSTLPVPESDAQPVVVGW
jgi:EAL domain-containing protein (putative c-di-GMP-specific phosphodiesterase class I)